ncbi:DUF7119 family protein [Natronobacterium gregoryi]|uniref:DUF7119 domain-containing protein n=2 Tax=Natronobacterium gregoryi TaxID=44930 RepID=L0AI16_NATGS|nr:hypothetical protein [Natronobacterium gregoryi]AFZ73084.1 hypothetical protein Natgr_1900 [Natronobacterium gregoryi SP2]ELY70816.1 hypothetical protein C490_05982 [Natronobacterium gregoryi SP2]PLK20395.1 hypothetical protein CYV19_09715 [Natronobacterium gregoryi SP2]SFI61505.1 hypothetical protein SAMN05443661_102181 [Natronobacterium gregoryi]
MTDERPRNSPNGRDEAHRENQNQSRSTPTDRESPVGEPVIRGDESVTGSHAHEAVQFDPADPDSLEDAADTVRRFATDSHGNDHLLVLRGAAACAALVRGEGSYKAAAERAGTDVTVSFIRKWARVHDLPRSIRKQVASGDIAPTAAKHIARVGGEARLLLAWAILDSNLTVRDVRRAASATNDGTPIEQALAEHDVTLGQLELTLSPPTYRDLRRRAAIDDIDPSKIVTEALENHLE